jgi:hypothetical protein
MISPVPTPEQAVHVLRILEEWSARGWPYRVRPLAPDLVSVTYIYDEGPVRKLCAASGVNHFDALCQATTVMQVLLEEYPQKE